MLFKAQTVSPSCPLVMTPPSIVVQFGGAFTVDCNSTTDQREGMGWESTYKGIGLTEVDHVQLNIEKVDRWAIQSQCFMTLMDGNQCSESLPITVYQMPDAVSLFLRNTTQTLEEHKDYEFQCDVVNVAPVKNVLVTWYKDDRSILHKEWLSAKTDDTPLNGSSFYTLTAQKTDNGRKLMCEATFDFGSTGPNLQPVRSPSMDLQVLYRPFFEESKVETVEVSGNRKVTLDCTAQGNPTPRYQWQVPQPVQQKVGTAPILDLSGPFSGNYSCRAFNSQGYSVKVFVIREAPRNYTVLAAVVGVTAALGLLLLISGLFIVTKDGTFSLNKGGYSQGQPSKPI